MSCPSLVLLQSLRPFFTGAQHYKWVEVSVAAVLSASETISCADASMSNFKFFFLCFVVLCSGLNQLNYLSSCNPLICFCECCSKEKLCISVSSALSARFPITQWTTLLIFSDISCIFESHLITSHLQCSQFSYSCALPPASFPKIH